MSRLPWQFRSFDEYIKSKTIWHVIKFKDGANWFIGGNILFHYMLNRLTFKPTNFFNEIIRVVENNGGLKLNKYE